jgi:hypothetical protein
MRLSIRNGDEYVAPRFRPEPQGEFMRDRSSRPQYARRFASLTAVVICLLSASGGQATASASDLSITTNLGGWVKGASHDINVLARPSDGSNRLVIDVLVDGGTVKHIDCACSTYGSQANDGTWVAKYAASYDTSALADGSSHTLVVKLTKYPSGLQTSTSSAFSVDRSNPISSPTGPLKDAAGGFLGGAGPYAITLAGHDDVSGVGRFFWTNSNTNGTLTSGTVQVCSTTCAHDATSPAKISLTEGRHTLSVAAYDLAGNMGSSGSWSVSVDRTAPVPPTTGFVAFYDPDLDGTVIGWPAVGDPSLPDGTPGVGGVSYRYRVSQNGGAYTDWADTLRPAVVVSGGNSGATFQIDVIALDALGNASAPVTVGSLTVQSVDPQAMCDDAFGTDDEARLLFCHTYLPPTTSLAAGGPDAYGLTPGEKAFCASRPYHCWIYNHDAAAAFRYTERLFTGQRKNSDGTRANAFQHAVWNALMVESDNTRPDLALAFSTAHEDHKFEQTNDDLVSRWQSRQDMQNNLTGNIFGKKWSPTKNDTFMCQGMLDNNRNSGEYIGADVDPDVYMTYHAQDPRQEIWRKQKDLTGLTVNPTGLDC